MHQIFANPDWGYIINAVSIILGIISLLLTIKIPLERDLSIIDIKCESKNQQSSVDKATELIMHKLTIVFKNLSKVVIYEKDFLNGISIEFFEPCDIREVNVSSTCKYSTVTTGLNGLTLLVRPDFLEGFKMMNVEVRFFSKMQINCKVSNKVIGGTDINEIVTMESLYNHNYWIGKKQADTWIFRLPFIVIGTFFLLLSLFEKAFRLNHQQISETITRLDMNSFWLMLIMLFIIICCIIVGRAFLRISLPFAILAKKEKKWFIKN